MKIVSLICHNGLGHFKRSIAVLNAIKSRIGCDILVLCEKWQVERMKSWKISQEFWDARTKPRFGIIEPGVHWAKEDELEYLNNWENRLSEIKELDDADIVISDNLTGVLPYRPDAILLGSFLWSDVLKTAYPGNRYVQAFSAHEQLLLKKYKPTILCVDDMVMDGVEARTNTVRMPWFCEDNRLNKENTGKNKIALLGGATKAADSMLMELAIHLSGNKELEILVPKSLKNENKDGQITVFNFSDKEFEELALVVCRPGIGTITDCVSNGIPIIAIFESDNIEMAHNAKRIAKLGIGKSFSVNEHIPTMIGGITGFLNSVEYQEAIFNINKLKCGGITEAAEWIINRNK